MSEHIAPELGPILDEPAAEAAPAPFSREELTGLVGHAVPESSDQVNRIHELNSQILEREDGVFVGPDGRQVKAAEATELRRLADTDWSRVSLDWQAAAKAKAYKDVPERVSNEILGRSLSSESGAYRVEAIAQEGKDRIALARDIRLKKREEEARATQGAAYEAEQAAQDASYAQHLARERALEDSRPTRNKPTEAEEAGRREKFEQKIADLARETPLTAKERAEADKEAARKAGEEAAEKARRDIETALATAGSTSKPAGERSAPDKTDAGKATKESTSSSRGADSGSAERARNPLGLEVAVERLGEVKGHVLISQVEKGIFGILGATGYPTETVQKATEAAHKVLTEADVPTTSQEARKQLDEALEAAREVAKEESAAMQVDLARIFRKEDGTLQYVGVTAADIRGKLEFDDDPFGDACYYLSDGIDERSLSRVDTSLGVSAQRIASEMLELGKGGSGEKIAMVVTAQSAEADSGGTPPPNKKEVDNSAERERPIRLDVGQAEFAKKSLKFRFSGEPAPTREQIERDLAESQDVALNLKEAHVFGIFDGMGGGGGDPKSAATAASRAVERVLGGAVQPTNATEAVWQVREAMAAARDAVATNPEQGGTTAMFTRIFRDEATGQLKLAYGNAGDSRMFRFDGKNYTEIGSEQVSPLYGNELTNALMYGATSEEHERMRRLVETATTRKNGSAITEEDRREMLRAELDQFGVVTIKEGDRIMICSDGITGDDSSEALSDAEFRDAFSQASAQQSANRFQKLSKKYDDKSVLVIDVLNGDAEVVTTPPVPVALEAPAAEAATAATNTEAVLTSPAEVDNQDDEGSTEEPEEDTKGEDESDEDNSEDEGEQTATQTASNAAALDKSTIAKLNGFARKPWRRKAFNKIYDNLSPEQQEAYDRVNSARRNFPESPALQRRLFGGDTLADPIPFEELRPEVRNLLYNEGFRDPNLMRDVVLPDGTLLGPGEIWAEGPQWLAENPEKAAAIEEKAAAGERRAADNQNTPTTDPGTRMLFGRFGPRVRRNGANGVQQVSPQPVPIPASARPNRSASQRGEGGDVGLNILNPPVEASASAASSPAPKAPIILPPAQSPSTLSTESDAGHEVNDEVDQWYEDTYGAETLAILRNLQAKAMELREAITDQDAEATAKLSDEYKVIKESLPVDEADQERLGLSYLYQKTTGKLARWRQAPPSPRPVREVAPTAATEAKEGAAAPLTDEEALHQLFQEFDSVAGLPSEAQGKRYLSWDPEKQEAFDNYQLKRLDITPGKVIHMRDMARRADSATKPAGYNDWEVTDVHDERGRTLVHLKNRVNGTIVSKAMQSLLENLLSDGGAWFE